MRRHKVMNMKTRMSVIVYLVLTFAGSAICYAQVFAGASLNQVAILLMWMPGLAAMVTQLLFYRTLGGLGWRRPHWRDLAIAVAIPIAYCIIIYLPVWLTGLGRVDTGKLAQALALAPLGVAASLLTALGEEIGWRGFLAPALYRLGGFGWASLTTGLIWGIWHLPLILSSDYNAGTPSWYAVPCFMVSVTGLSVMLARLRLHSDSLWPAALFHATHNAIIQGVFDASTIDTGPTRWITSEFGVGLTLVSIILGIYFWRRGDLPAGQDMAPIAAAPIKS